jgi:Flp pilus assembly pilin Flp
VLFWRGQEGVGVRLKFERLWRDQRGASLIDYAILAALITVLVVVGVAVAGSWIKGMWAHMLPLLG